MHSTRVLVWSFIYFYSIDEILCVNTRNSTFIIDCSKISAVELPESVVKLIKATEKSNTDEYKGYLMFVLSDIKPLRPPTHFGIVQQHTNLRDEYLVKFTKQTYYLHWGNKRACNRNEEIDPNDIVTDFSFDSIKPHSIVKINLNDHWEVDKYLTADHFKWFGIDWNPESPPHFQILELRIASKIKESWQLQKILDFCKYNTNLRDLEIKVDECDYASDVFEALSNNYVIKTLRVYSVKAARKDIVEEAAEFKSKRIALDLQLNTKDPRFASTKKRSSEFYYPGNDVDNLNLYM